MKHLPIKLSEIYGFHAVDDRLGTAGQPTQSQFQVVRESGFDAVINLALPTSDNAIPNEGSVVTSLGMAYVHIPVDFKRPTPQDFRAFCRVMEAFDDRPVFVQYSKRLATSFRASCINQPGFLDLEGRAPRVPLDLTTENPRCVHMRRRPKPQRGFVTQPSGCPASRAGGTTLGHLQINYFATLKAVASKSTALPFSTIILPIIKNAPFPFDAPFTGT
jgi:protein tyrosine phosphatase (PTP) superfamily phosphohydrolase (DUF442 family)